jgi:hypothetical protein
MILSKGPSEKIEIAGALLRQRNQSGILWQDEEWKEPHVR